MGSLSMVAIMLFVVFTLVFVFVLLAGVLGTMVAMVRRRSRLRAIFTEGFAVVTRRKSIFPERFSIRTKGNGVVVAWLELKRS